MVKQITAQFYIDGSGVEADDHDNPITLCKKNNHLYINIINKYNFIRTNLICFLVFKNIKNK